MIIFRIRFYIRNKCVHFIKGAEQNTHDRKMNIKSWQLIEGRRKVSGGRTFSNVKRKESETLCEEAIC